MSTFILWIRAGLMLACVTAVPLTAAFRPGLFAGACKAVSECVKRLSGDDTDAAREAAKVQLTEDASQPAPHSDAIAAVADRFNRYIESMPPAPDDPLPTTPVALADSPVASVSQRTPPAARPSPASPPTELAAWQHEAAQLQHLGAVHYALQEWGGRDGVYRFHCRVALSGDPSCQRHFSAIDADAGRAVRLVIDRVREFHRSIAKPTQSASTFAETEPQ